MDSEEEIRSIEKIKKNVNYKRKKKDNEKRIKKKSSYPAETKIYSPAIGFLFLLFAIGGNG